MIIKVMLGIFLYKVTILALRITLKVIVKHLEQKVDKDVVDEIHMELQKVKEWINE